MAAIERTYNIPLRKDFLRAPRYKRAKKAVSALKLFLQRHMKSDDIRIGKHLNKKLWEHGIKNPPHHVKVNVLKEEDGTVRAELFGAPKEEKKAKQRTPKGTKKQKKAEEKAVVAKEETKPEDKAPEAAEQEDKPKKSVRKAKKAE